MKSYGYPSRTEYWRSTFVIAFVDEDKVILNEASAREQSEFEIWNRFLASSFQLIAKWQRNHESFALYVAHGMKYEPAALQQYEKNHV